MENEPTKVTIGPVHATVFEAWKEYQIVAMHFNDLLMRLRSQSLAAVAGLSTIAAVVIKAGVDPALQWGALAGAFLFLSLFWIAIWILDFSYYNRLLIGAVDALIEIEKQSPQGRDLTALVLSTRIEALVARREEPVNGKLGGERARWFFYVIVFLTLSAGLLISASRAGWFSHTAQDTILDCSQEPLMRDVLRIRANGSSQDLSFTPERNGTVTATDSSYDVRIPDPVSHWEIRFRINRFTGDAQRQLYDDTGKPDTAENNLRFIACKPYQGRPF